MLIYMEFGMYMCEFVFSVAHVGSMCDFDSIRKVMIAKTGHSSFMMGMEFGCQVVWIVRNVVDQYVKVAFKSGSESCTNN